MKIKAPVEEAQQEATVETVQPSYETSEPVVESPVEMTEEEKENVATLLASLNL